MQKYNEARLINMEIKRKIYKKIVKWKKQANGSKALLIEGDYVKIGLNQEKPYK